MISPGWNRDRNPKGRNPLHYRFNRYSYLASVERMKRQEREEFVYLSLYRSYLLRTRAVSWTKTLDRLIDNAFEILKLIAKKAIKEKLAEVDFSYDDGTDY